MDPCDVRSISCSAPQITRCIFCRGDGPNNGGGGVWPQASSRDGRPAELAARRPPPQHHVVPHIPAGRADVRAVAEVGGPLALRSAPCLSIDQREFNELEFWAASKTLKTVRFVNFVDNLLMFHRAESLDTFRFQLSNRHGCGVAHQCLRRCIECCPEVLEFCYSYYGNYMLHV